MTRYQNQTLTGQVYKVEETWFVNCTLRDCVLFYSGGTFQWENTTFQNCQWKFQNEAQQTVMLLAQIGALPPMHPIQVQQRPPQPGPVN